MCSSIVVAQSAIDRAKKRKIYNALTAVLTGGLPALLLAVLIPQKLEESLLGFLGGLLWANGFEYLYHRFMLHSAKGLAARRHQEHHWATGSPDEAEHVNFGSSPFWAFILIAVNGGPIIFADLVFDVRIAPGMLTAFVLYYIALEEIHWRVHLGGYLPPGLRLARRYHLAHHDRADGRFNVFLPLFDWLLNTKGSPYAESRPA